MEKLLSWADHRVFKGFGEPFIFAVDDASLFSLTHEAHETLSRWHRSEFVDLDEVPSEDLEVLEGFRDAQILIPAACKRRSTPALEVGQVPLCTLVLEVAQDCNLRCTYCYAEGGTYGAVPCLLDPDMARQAVRYLLDNSADQEHVTLVIFGGEPLLNMPAVRAAIDEAISHADRVGKTVHFSLTTNGTLLDPEIISFLHDNRVAVAISLDGPRHIHDRNRPDEKGHGTYSKIVSRMGMLLEDSPIPIAARVTLVPDQWQDVVQVFDHLIALGLHEVGIAPASPVSKALLPTPAQEEALLKGFSRLAERFIAVAKRGQVLPFSNILDLLGRLHLGQSKQVSCGAGYGYMAVDAKGQFFPCHRLAGEVDFRAGSLATGIDTLKISVRLGLLNKGREQSCSRCWARTFCAGGCHYENHLRENQLGLPRGTSCKFIRSWLEIGMQTYAELRTNGAIQTMGQRLAQRAQC